MRIIETLNANSALGYPRARLSERRPRTITHRGLVGGSVLPWADPLKIVGELA